MLRVTLVLAAWLALTALALWAVWGAATDGPQSTDDEREHRARTPRSRDAHVHDGGRRARREHARQFRADVERFAHAIGAKRLDP
jgi:hypothetical protein